MPLSNGHHWAKCFILFVFPAPAVISNAKCFFFYRFTSRAAAASRSTPTPFILCFSHALPPLLMRAWCWRYLFADDIWWCRYEWWLMMMRFECARRKLWCLISLPSLGLFTFLTGIILPACKILLEIGIDEVSLDAPASKSTISYGLIFILPDIDAAAAEFIITATFQCWYRLPEMAIISAGRFHYGDHRFIDTPFSEAAALFTCTLFYAASFYWYFFVTTIDICRAAASRCRRYSSLDISHWCNTTRLLARHYLLAAAPRH